MVGAATSSLPSMATSRVPLSSPSSTAGVAVVMVCSTTPTADLNGALPSMTTSLSPSPSPSIAAPTAATPMASTATTADVERSPDFSMAVEMPQAAPMTSNVNEERAPCLSPTVVMSPFSMV